MTRAPRTAKTATLLGLTASVVSQLATGVPARAEDNTIAPCHAGNIGSMSRIVKTIDKRAPGSASSSRSFTNSFTFVAPAGYMIASANVERLKGGANASYSDKWLPSGGSFSSRTQSNNAYQESLNFLAAFDSSEGYARAKLDYETAGSQMSSWYNQAGSGSQGSYEFTMSVSPNSVGDGLFDAYQDVIGRYRVTLGLRCVGTPSDQRTYFRAVAQRLVDRYRLAQGRPNGGGTNQQGGAGHHQGHGNGNVATEPNYNLNGWWRGNNKGYYSIQQSGSNMQMKGFVDGRTVNLFTGQIDGNTITGSWQDYSTNRSGTLTLRYQNGQLVKTGGSRTFNTSWTRSQRPADLDTNANQHQGQTSNTGDNGWGSSANNPNGNGGSTQRPNRQANGISCENGRQIGRFALRSELTGKYVRGGVTAGGTNTAVGAKADQIGGSSSWETFDIYDVGNRGGLNGNTYAFRSSLRPDRWLSVASNGSLQLAPGSCTTATRSALFLANQVGNILQMQALGNQQWVIQRSNGMLYANAPTAGGNVPKALQFSLQTVGR